MTYSSSKITNFLPEQYLKTNRLDINHNYLSNQFSDYEEIFSKIREVVIRGDFTLGKDVDLLEEEFATLCKTTYAVSVASGTDALFLSLKALGIGEGDEVITTPFTFFATVGAIVTSGAKPVFVDIQDDYNIDPFAIEANITKKTKAIMPVHWSGRPCEMDVIEKIAAKHGIPVISDACHAINARYRGRQAGELGTIACFSFHPLKNLNVWGDGGIIATNSSEIANKLRLIRNHGLINRDNCQIFSYNSRLDTIQAVVARHMLKKINHITQRRIENAEYFDQALSQISGISIPARVEHISEVFHIYSLMYDDRDSLQKFLVSNGVDAKIHYPIPMHLQPAALFLNYKLGDFPKAEYVASKTMSLPVHEFVTKNQQDRVVKLIKEFYG